MMTLTWIYGFILWMYLSYYQAKSNCLDYLILRIHDDRFHGGFTVCCNTTHDLKLDFHMIVNTSPTDMEDLYEFMHDPTAIWTKKLDYFDCDCYFTHYPLRFVTPWYAVLVFAAIQIIHKKHLIQRFTGKVCTLMIL
jgi:hypothetical protein